MSPLRRRLPIRWVLALFACTVAVRSARADGTVFDDEKENYQVTVPPTWIKTAPAPALVEKYGVKLQVERRLEKLKDGSPAKGEGGRFMLAVQDTLPKSLDPDYETWLAEWQILKSESTRLHGEWDGAPDPPKAVVERMTLVDKSVDERLPQIEKALLAVANDQEMQRMLLSRYDPDPKKWPTPEVDERDTLMGIIPTVTIKVKGVECPNLEGNPGRCEARLMICVLRKKIYRLAFWVWPQKFDPERLAYETTDIEMNFQFIKTTAIPRKASDKPVLPGGPAAAQPSGPELEEKTITELAMTFSVLKPKGWRSLPIDRSKPGEAFFGFRFVINDSTGAEIAVDSFVYRVSGGGSGYDLDEYLTKRWPEFLQMHPTGVLVTHPFPTYNEKNPFLSLPNFEKKIILKRPPPPGKDKDAPKFSKNDLEQKGVLSETKQVVIAKEKARFCWRFCMFGQAMGGIGDDLGIHYCFSTSEKSFVIRVFIRKDARDKWGADLKRMLESFKIIDAAK